jgi:flagellar M-ring protein FliF
VLGALALTSFVSRPSFAQLYGNLSGPDASAVVEQLQAQGVQYELANGGSTVLVPQSQVDEVRVSLLGKNLPAGDSGGWSLLDKQGMTSTDFQQNVAYQRALEGELSKTLQAMSGVRTAIVHVAIPKKDVFTKDTDKPTASVLLALQPGTEFGRAQVKSVTRLVAGSVPGMDPAAVTVSDANGALLTGKDGGAAGGAGGSGGDGGENDAQTAQYEDRLAGSAQKMLDTVLGPGHAVVRVNARLNYDSTETTKQTYGTQPPVPIVQRTASEKYTGAAGGTGGMLGGTWPTLSPGTGAAGGGNYEKSEGTVNNGVNSEVSKATGAPGRIERLTAAVVLDSGKAGAITATQVQQLVANAIGVDAARGDTVQVDKLAFDTTAAAAAQEQLAAAEAAAKQAQYVDLATKAGIGLLVLVALVVALRRSRRNRPPRVEAVARDLPPDQVLLAKEMQAALAAGALGPAAITSEAEDASRQRDRLREEVSAFVDSQPDEIAQLVQGWLSQRAK